MFTRDEMDEVKTGRLQIEKVVRLAVFRFLCELKLVGDPLPMSINVLLSL